MGGRRICLQPVWLRALRGTPWACALLVVLLLDVSPTNALDSSLLRGQHFIRRGMRAMERGDLAAAEAAFFRARSVAPRLPQPHVLLGRLAMRRGDLDDAEAAFLEAIERYRRLDADLRRESNRRAGELIERRDRITLQGHGMDDRGRSSPELLEGHGRSGRRLPGGWVHGTGRPAAVRVPAELHLLLGNARLMAGRPEEAVPAYRDALRADRRLAEAHHNLALALLASGRAEEALTSCRKAERLGLSAAAGLRQRLEDDLGGGPDARAVADEALP